MPYTNESARFQPIKISVVIPSHRRGAKIGPTLESLKSQTLLPHEIIVVNDGSYPETTNFLETNFPNVQLINIEQSGAAVARNIGVRASSNAIVALIDDDDTFRPEGLEVLLSTLLTFPEARSAHGDNSYTNLITGEYRERNNRDIPILAQRFTRISPRAERDGVQLFGKPLYYELLRGNFLQQPWIFYRESYLAVGGFQSGFVSADDWDIYLSMARNFPTALTNKLVGHQFTEPGRSHLTHSPDQLAGQMNATRRQLGLAGWADPRAVVILRRKLGGQYKMVGDRTPAGNLAAVWRAYLSSLFAWPLDQVVVIRAILLLPLRLAAKHLLSKATH